jgi:hypothetical protein
VSDGTAAGGLQCVRLQTVISSVSLNYQAVDLEPVSARPAGSRSLCPSGSSSFPRRLLQSRTVHGFT